MTPHEQALILMGKAGQDEALVDEVLDAAHISDEIVGFHCQQAAEKLLKALLAEKGIHFEKTHNLHHLLNLLADAGVPVPQDLEDLDELTPFAVLLRYASPGMEEPGDRRAWREMVRRVREWVEPQIQGQGRV